MNAWLAVQILYAAVAWFLCAQNVARVHYRSAFWGKPLARMVRDVRAQHGTRLPTIPERLGAPWLEALFESEGPLRPDELIAGAEYALEQLKPPLRMLRALATMGTMLGLLAAIAVLRVGLNDTDPGGMESATAHAFDSAVLGFVTALPCWTAVALCHRRYRSSSGELDLVVLALGPSKSAPAEGSSAPRSEGSEPPKNA